MGKCKIRSSLKWVVTLSTLLTANHAFGSGNQSSSARATGMGNAFVAVAHDPSAMFYNPAGLADIPTWMFYVHYAKKSKYGWGGEEKPFLASGVLVAPFCRNVSIGLSGLKGGSWANQTGVISTNLEALSLAARVSPRVAVGFLAKSIHNSNYGNSKGADFDLGALFEISPRLRLGLAVENLLATDIRTDVVVPSPSGHDPTRTGKAGLLCHLDRLHGDLTFDLALDDVRGGTKATYFQSSLGIETQALTTGRLDLALRAGYTVGREYGRTVRQSTTGFGIRCRGARSVCEIDYSWQNYPYESNETSVGDHRVSVTIYPRVPQSKKQLLRQEEATYPPQAQRWSQDPLPLQGPKEPGMSVRTERVLSGQEEFVIFLVESGAVDHVTEWKLHIYAEDADRNTVELNPLTTLHGWVMPANSVLWDLKLDGERIASGTYHYRLEVSDTQSNSWISDLGSFRIR